jgi:hypothetical protein
MSSTARESYYIYLHELQDQVFEDFSSCKECEYCEETRDPYGTGDSPTMYECTAIPNECEQVMMQIE